MKFLPRFVSWLVGLVSCPSCSSGVVSPICTESDKVIIRRFAAGEKDLRACSIAIFHNALDPNSEWRSVPELLFMSEVDNVCPDLGLRASYRRQILESHVEES